MVTLSCVKFKFNPVAISALLLTLALVKVGTPSPLMECVFTTWVMV